MTVKADVVRVAVIQASPVFLDRDASLEKAVRLISEAANKGASLAAFGEGWVPGYPVHAWSLANSELWWELAAAYLDQAVDFQSAVIDTLCSAAGKANIDIVIGLAEREPNYSWLSLFDAVVHWSRGSNPWPPSKIEACIIRARSVGRW